MRKAISSTMEIIIALVVILVAALVILSIFGIQIGGISQPIQYNTDFAYCQTQCAQFCLTHPNAATWDSAASATCKVGTFSCDCKTPPGPAKP